MKYPFLRHITKIRNSRGKVKHSIIYFQQFIHFFLLKPGKKTDGLFTSYRPSVHPSQTMCLSHLHRPFTPSQTMRLPRLHHSFHPSQTVHLPHLHRPSPPRRPRIHPACTTRSSQPHYPYSPYPFISNNELLYISNEYIIYSLTSHSASAIP